MSPLFLLASLALAVTPGPGVLFIVARALAAGRRAALLSVAGVALGNFANAVAAALGLAAVLASSSMAFTVLKWAGAAYLLYLGLRAWRAPAATVESSALLDASVDGRGPAGKEATAAADSPRAAPGSFREAFWVALLNPKTTLFFAAFLPPFVQPGASVLAQTLGLGATFVAIAAVTDTAYALGAAWLRPWLSRGPRLQVWGRRASAAVYVLLGVFAALAEHRPATR